MNFYPKNRENIQNLPTTKDVKFLKFLGKKKEEKFHVLNASNLVIREPVARKI